MTIQRMEHVGIVVDDLAAATEFFVELGLELQGEGIIVELAEKDRLTIGREGLRMRALFVPAYPVAVRRAFFLLPAIAVATALLAVPAGVASGAGPERGTVVRVEFELNASNGLHAHLENSEDGTVTLELRGKGQIVNYEVPGEATEAGLKVRFGRLGLIDVAFTPTETLNSTEPGEGCTGAPRTLREGVFAGTIDFTGEREFVRIEGPQATGSMSVISQWECPEAEAMDPFARVSRLLAATSRREKGERESATLSAGSRGCSCYFAAGVHHRRSGGHSIFLGVKLEKREGMEIVRGTQVRGPASAFSFDHAAGTARLRPPSPLSGHASFEAHAHGRGLWRSTIRVPLLGADPIDTGGPGFAAILSPEYQFD
jgi:catechol 2,3-dioxygenase-like lactoylglutathione lyase family enzyme